MNVAIVSYGKKEECNTDNKFVDSDHLLFAAREY